MSSISKPRSITISSKLVGFWLCFIIFSSSFCLCVESVFLQLLIFLPLVTICRKNGNDVNVNDENELYMYIRILMMHHSLEMIIPVIGLGQDFFTCFLGSFFYHCLETS